MRKSIISMSGQTGKATPRPPCQPIVMMSFQLAIPWRVALPQSPPPLRQPIAVSFNWSLLAIRCQRTATCPYLPCLKVRVQSRALILLISESKSGDKPPPFAVGRIARVIAVGLPHHVTQRGNGRRGVFHAGEPGTEHSFYSFLKWEIRDSHRKSRIHLIAPVTQELPAEWPSDAFGDNYNRNYPGIKPLFRECQGRLESHNTIDAVVRP
jgi:hypothetical protein